MRNLSQILFLTSFIFVLLGNLQCGGKKKSTPFYEYGQIICTTSCEELVYTYEEVGIKKYKASKHFKVDGSFELALKNKDSTVKIKIERPSTGGVCYDGLLLKTPIPINCPTKKQLSVVNFNQ